MRNDTIPITEFKANCLMLMTRMHKTRRPLTITKRGKVFAKVMPMDEGKKSDDALYGAMKGTVTILGDIVGPFHDEWNER